MINISFLSLSNYRLSIQLLVINLFIIFFGTIFLLLFNYYLIKNDNQIERKISLSIDELKEITSFLEKNSIINIPLYQTNFRCRVIDKDDDLYQEINCENENLFIDTLQLSDRELERFIVEQYIYNNYFRKDFNIKIFNDNWIEIADSDDPYLSMDVNESEIFEKKPNKTSFLDKYKEKYYGLFNNIYFYILHNKFAAVSSKRSPTVSYVI